MAAKPNDSGGGGERKVPPAPPADPTRRFSDRVADYVKYRPTYPPVVLRFLTERAGLTPRSVVADVGAGTGISARLFLENGNTVYAVEPNADMRRAADELLTTYLGYRGVDGTAEATTLPAASVDLVVAAQAFHWFDPDRAGAEFRRILRPGGRVALLWNTRKTCGSAFLKAYERLLNEYGTDYAAVRHDRLDDGRLARFFAGGYERVAFPNEQRLDFGGLRGRLLSSSYAPAPGQPRHDEMLAALRDVFERFQTGGWVVIEYETEVYIGPSH